MIYRLIFISILLVQATLGFATHIVGGELMYRLLDRETNTYRVTAQIFFDCENGNPQAIASDQTLYISQWDAKTKQFQRDFTVSTFNQTQVTKSEDYACINGPRNVCVTAYLYSAEVQIDPGENGVILAWQRCCRNRIIDNIVTPEATGFTAWTTIPPSRIENSSPLFTDIPPIYICVDAPLDITQEAFDFDGDSLAYKMSTPYRGGARAPDERIRPSSQQWYDRPDFQSVFWANGYDSKNPIPGEPALNLDARTGRLTMTPTERGVYVIGLLVEEWRDGLLLGVTRRDYQISVIQCDFNILANYRLNGGDVENGIYSFGCEDTVKLTNLSFVEPSISAEFHWDFGVPDTEDDKLITYDINDPVEYAYPGNGDYTITLTVKSDECEDEYEYQVRIRSSPPFDLGEDKVYCNDFVLDLYTRDPDAPDILWNTGSTRYSITVRDTGTYSVTVSYGECSYTDEINIGLDAIPDFSLIEDTLFCDEVLLEAELQMPNKRPEIKFAWTTSPQDTFTTVTITEPGTYSVTAANGNCALSKDMTVRVADQPEVPDALYCNEFIHTATVEQFPDATYSWSNGDQGLTSQISIFGQYWVESQQKHCRKRDTFNILNPVVSLDLGEDRNYCDSLNVVLDAGTDRAFYNWNTNDVSKTIQVNQPGFYKVEVRDTNGCVAVDSVTLTLSQSPRLSLGNDTTICKNSPTLLSAPAGFAYEWNVGSNEQQISIRDGGSYSVKITDDSGCFDIDTLEVIVDEGALPNDIYIPNSFTPNDDQLNDMFPFSESVKQTEYYILIFNRWGEKVFDSRTSDTPNWDGFYKGKRATQAAYIYYAYYRGCDGQARTRKGTVTPLF